MYERGAHHGGEHHPCNNQGVCVHAQGMLHEYEVANSNQHNTILYTADIAISRRNCHTMHKIAPEMPNNAVGTSLLANGDCENTHRTGTQRDLLMPSKYCTCDLLVACRHSPRRSLWHEICAAYVYLAGVQYANTHHNTGQHTHRGKLSLQDLSRRTHSQLHMRFVE
mmetsp:Transcript_32776/g.101516  ORF Transcript_32776/g.101516 Transcript_32776/m.101516 type:complete len:167 (-) Transcript_32776:4365-4865(-)